MKRNDTLTNCCDQRDDDNGEVTHRCPLS